MRTQEARPTYKLSSVPQTRAKRTCQCLKAGRRGCFDTTLSCMHNSLKRFGIYIWFGESTYRRRHTIEREAKYHGQQGDRISNAMPATAMIAGMVLTFVDGPALMSSLPVNTLSGYPKSTMPHSRLCIQAPNCATRFDWYHFAQQGCDKADKAPVQSLNNCKTCTFCTSGKNACNCDQAKRGDIRLVISIP